MGQQNSSTSTSASAAAAETAPNVLARDYAGMTVTVHCVEVCSESVQKLQALLAAGGDAAQLEAALPSERFSGTASTTIADVRAFLQGLRKHQVSAAPISEAERQYYDLPDSATAAATAPTTIEVPVYLYALQGSGASAKPALLHDTTRLEEVLRRPDVCVPSAAGGEGCSLWLLYSTKEPAQGFDDICCCIGLCAACCACIVGLCCCAAMAKKQTSSKPTNNNNNNNNNYDNGATYNTGASNPYYSPQQQQYNGQQQQYNGGQQYSGQQQQGAANSYGAPPQQQQQQGQGAQPSYYNYAANPL